MIEEPDAVEEPDGPAGSTETPGPDRDLTALEELEVEHRELLAALDAVETSSDTPG